MSEGRNLAILVGNLGQNPELRHTQSGQSVLNLRMATTEKYKDRDGNMKEQTDWHSVTVWGRRGEALSKFLRKGATVYVEGSIRNSSFEGRDGTKRYKSEVNARNILLLGDGKRSDSGRQDAPAASDNSRPYETDGGEVNDDDIPF